MNQFTKTFSVLKLNLRRDRIYIFVWLIPIILYGVVFAPAFQNVYASSANSLNQIVSMIQTPALKAMIGILPKATHYTVGDVYVSMMITYLGLFNAIFNLMLSIRSTRGDEENGVTEQLRAASIGKQSPITAAVIENVIVNLLIILVIGGGLTFLKIDGLNAAGSFLFASQIAGIGMLFSAIGLLSAQLFESSRMARLMSFALLSVMYIWSIYANVNNENKLWYSPFGWVELAKINHGNSLIPFSLMLITSIILLLLAFVLNSKRDLGAGLFPTPVGRTTAPFYLNGVVGLTFKTQWLVTLILIIVAFSVGMLYGSIAPNIADLIKSNATFSSVIGITEANKQISTLVLSFISQINIIFMIFAMVVGVVF